MLSSYIVNCKDSRTAGQPDRRTGSARYWEYWYRNNCVCNRNLINHLVWSQVFLIEKNLRLSSMKSDFSPWLWKYQRVDIHHSFGCFSNFTNIEYCHNGVGPIFHFQHSWKSIRNGHFISCFNDYISIGQENTWHQANEPQLPNKHL